MLTRMILDSFRFSAGTGQLTPEPEELTARQEHGRPRASIAESNPDYMVSHSMLSTYDDHFRPRTAGPAQYGPDAYGEPNAGCGDTGLGGPVAHGLVSARCNRCESLRVHFPKTAPTAGVVQSHIPEKPTPTFASKGRISE